MRSLTETGYHMFLRTAALTCALVLLFQSGVIDPSTHAVSLETQSYLVAAVGMSAAVTPTPLNEYTAALTAKEQQLNQQEQQLQQREIAVNLAQNGGTNSYSTFILSIIVFILLVLIITNYVLDYVRYRRQVRLSRV